MKRILFLYYSHSGHTEKMILAAAEEARQAGAEAIVKKTPDAVREDLVNCEAVILGTGNYFQKEAGMFRDYWDRYDYDWLKMKTEFGIKPYAWVVSAGVGGDSCTLTINNLMKDLNFRRIFPTVIAFEDPTEDDLVNCRKLGRQMAELKPADDYPDLDPPSKQGRWKWPEKVRVITQKGIGVEIAHAWGDLLAQEVGTKLVVAPETDTVNRFKMMKAGRFHYATGTRTETSQMIMANRIYSDRDSGPFPARAVWICSRSGADSPILLLAHKDTNKFLVYRSVGWLHQNYDRIKGRHEWLKSANLDTLLVELKHTFLPVHDGLKLFLQGVGLWTNAFEESSEANAVLVDRYCQAFQECQDMADEKEVAVRHDNPEWLETWGNYKREISIPLIKVV
ncbi:MAG: hypothetical protein C4555_07670 [Dehalococcoidia bacterium]|jgi:multimeric flavodoxin WrbA|nr:MAG: hypothetical protein C4555_07670 [Dehalococcoidia bacterium]